VSKINTWPKVAIPVSVVASMFVLVLVVEAEAEVVVEEVEVEVEEVMVVEVMLTKNLSCNHIQ
jgi:hypothetical protein